MKNKSVPEEFKTVIVLLFSLAVYFLLFFIFLPSLKENSIIWGLIPVSIIAVLSDYRYGIMASLIYILIGFILAGFSGYSFAQIISSSWQSISGILITGILFGLLSGKVKQKRQVYAELVSVENNTAEKKKDIFKIKGKNLNKVKEDSAQNTSGILKEFDSLNEEILKIEKDRQQLVESNSRLKLALEAAQNGFADIKLKENQIYFSPILSKYLGYTSEELMQLSPGWENYIHLGDIDLVKDSISNLLSKKIPSAEFSHRVLTKSGHWKWFLTKIKIVETDELEKPLRLFIVTEDVSLRKKAEEELLNNLAKEQQLAEMRSRFVTLVSHEFRTPLSTILSSVELLENYGSTWPKEKSDIYYGKIASSIDYLISLLNEISLMSKAESNVLTFKAQKLELVSFFEELIDEVKGNYKEHPKIHFNINRKEFNTEYDKKLLRFIFHNLLVNSVKYTEPDKNIYIYCIFNQTEIFFSITDEGMGIPKEEQRTLFDPFTRASNVGDIKGTGLGLSIVKKTVEVCHGKLSLESELNKGTSFKVTLPLNFGN